MTFYNQHSTALVGAAGQPDDHLLEDSLRLRSSASAYLSRTFTTPTNNKIWTWSGWVKRGLLGGSLSYPNLFGTSSDEVLIYSATHTDRLAINMAAGVGCSVITTQVFRDPSAWYHIIIAVDTTQATSSNRVKIYVNGVQVTDFAAATYPSLNYNSSFNSAVVHNIGNNTATRYFDGYLTEVNFIDGQALDPSYFGETDTVTGVWKPAKYTGSYGTNGFYLPMTPTSQASGFNSVLYYGHPSNSAQSINGVGFSPDLVWIKSRVTGYGHCLSDSVRGATKRLQTDTTSAEATSSTYISSLDSDGFSLGVDYGQNAPNEPYVAWCWDAGSGSPASNTDGSITSTVKANQAKGFSIATFTGNGSNGATIGHGLGVSPEFVILKNRTNAFSWLGWNSQLSGSTYRLDINSTGAEYNDGVGALQGVSSSTITLGSGNAVNQSSANFVVYSFASISGYSKIGSYTGNGSTTGPTITTGFKPAWILIKRMDTAGDGWFIHDVVRDADNSFQLRLVPNTSQSEFNYGSTVIETSSTGFQIKIADQWINNNASTYVYMAFADTRDTAFNNDASGNQNNWIPNNINSNASGQSTYDLMKDVPTLTSENAANYATLNPNDLDGGFTFSEGNLKVTATSSARTRATIGVSSGKWYWETYVNAVSNGGQIGVLSSSGILSGYTDLGTQSFGWGIFTVPDSRSGQKQNNNTTSTYGGTITTGDLIMCALDMDTGSIYWGKNGQWANGSGSWNQSTPNTAAFTNLSGYTVAPAVAQGGGTSISWSVNFGQRPFTYTPPTGYKALNSYNLPDPTIADGSDYFDVKLWTGNSTGSSTQAISGMSFKPDWLWGKSRSWAYDHVLIDAVRGTNKILYSDLTNSESTNSTALSSFNSDGFTLGTDAGGLNDNGKTFVGWLWKANGSSSSNTAGSITSTVSANTTSGFSIVTYTGTGSTATVGHGLGVGLGMLIVKGRSVVDAWAVWHDYAGSNGQFLKLNATDALITQANVFNSTDPTSSVFSLGTNGQVNGSGQTYVAYCFAPIAGYSAFGSYTGNGSADGPFVYTGFRPAWLMLKRTDVANGWPVIDTKRDTYNVMGNYLYPNTSGAEATYYYADFTSNGFKLKATDAGVNASGGTYIYAAFAENPFKYSLAR